MAKSKPLRKIYYSSDFRKAFKKVPPSIQRKADQRLKIFKKNAFDPRLNTHKLKGKLSGYWSFYIDRRWRIMFAFVNKNEEVILLDIGLHDIYS